MATRDDYACIPEGCRDQHLPMVPEYADGFRKSGIRGVGLHEVDQPYEIRRAGAPWHLVLFTLSGTADWQGTGVSGSLRAGDVWIGAAETPHQFHATGPWQFVSAALFPIDRFAWLEHRVFAQTATSNLAHLWSAAEAYIYESTGDAHDAGGLAAHQAAYISANILRELKQEQEGADSRIRVRLRGVWESVNAGPGSAWSVAVMAQEANMSVRHFQRVMKEQYGVTAEAMLKKIRMEHARELLLSTELTLEQICERAGYQSVYAFSRAFKRYVGQSPGNYRKQKLHNPNESECQG